MAAHLHNSTHSRGITIHHRPPSIFSSFHHQKPSNSSLNTLNPSLNQLALFTKPKPQAKDSSHVFFKGNPLPPGRGAPNFKFFREKAPISKPIHHEKSFSYLSQHFPPSKAKNFHHLNELQNFKGASEPHFITSSCLRPEEDIPQLPRAIPYEESICHTCGPYSDSPRGPPTKKAKTSEPGESSRAPRDSQSQPPSTRRLDPARPLRATQIADPKHFMSRHILITLFCASRLTCGIHTAYLRASILFTIDGRQGILGARQIAEAFHIPYAPADPTAFRRWAPLSEWDMHTVQRRGAILEALFRISEGYYFGPHHLIMAALLHFEEDPQSEPRRHCRESFSLEQWNQYGSISIPQNFPSQGKSLLLHPLQLPRSLYQRQHHLMPHLLFLLPQSRPSLSLVQSTVPCSLLSDSDHYSDGHYGADGPLPDSAGPADSHSP
ncbi:hypothetical protein CK203_101105 [Vitis vinifera]|uniref:Uncharacterized protein n=1 Tax=Vitis vinifera TaxID=29760 RepID=A0A438CFE0_VITVI|nr:hypothetical protein CK203_101105 [Vitis vinifera]